MSGNCPGENIVRGGNCPGQIFRGGAVREPTGNNCTSLKKAFLEKENLVVTMTTMVCSHYNDFINYLTSL